jgi:hypothetical protein
VLLKLEAGVHVPNQAPGSCSSQKGMRKPVPEIREGTLRSPLAVCASGCVPPWVLEHHTARVSREANERAQGICTLLACTV